MAKPKDLPIPDPVIDDGGPAFPLVCDDCVRGGMTLRDYFAAHDAVEDETQFQAQAIMQSKPPQWSSEGDYDQSLKCVLWWAEARAKLKFIRADAMLAARKGGAA